MNTFAALPTLDPDLPAEGLDGDTGVAEAEALMVRLAVGERGGKAAVMSTEHLEGGGSRTRLRLALAAAEALGVGREAAAPWAAACELLHNASLVHDDVQDHDELRRDRPTVWRRHGVGQAINAGDLLLMLPFLAVGELGVAAETRWRLTRLLARAAERAVRGQAAEMELTLEGRVSWLDWTTAAEGKTSPLIALPVAGAAVLAGLDDRSAAALSRPFGDIGLVYQLQDDLLDLGVGKRRGEPGTDLRNGRVTSLVAAWCALAPDEAPGLLGWLRDPAARRDPAQVAVMIERMRQSGAVQEVRRRVDQTAARVRTDASLRAVPELHEVACVLLDKVLSAGRAVGGVR